MANNIEQFIAEHPELGLELSRVGVNFRHQLTKAFVFFVMLFIIYAISASFANPENTLHDSFALQIVVILMAVLFGGIALSASISFSSAFFKSLIVFDDGIVSKSSRGIRFWLWSEIDEVLFREVRLDQGGDAFSFSLNEFVVRGKDKSQLKINNDYAGFRDLTDLISKRVSFVLVPRHVAEFKRNQPLNYGNLEISREGVRKGKKFVSWQNIDSWEIADTERVDTTKIVFKFNGRRQLFALLNARPNAIALVQVMYEISDQVLSS